MSLGLTFTTLATTALSNPGSATSTDSVTVNLPASNTTADVSLANLATQLNGAFSTALAINPGITELHDLYAVVDAKGSLDLVTTNPSILSFGTTASGSSNLITSSA